MNQKSSLREVPHFVSGVLTGNIQEVAERAIAIRENMARLRALRLAKEAEADQSNTQPTEPRRKRERG